MISPWHLSHASLWQHHISFNPWIQSPDLNLEYKKELTIGPYGLNYQPMRLIAFEHWYNKNLDNFLLMEHACYN